ncbi:PREDICTED: uncharacterized protein LOC105627032 [Atta cephalotes]|uniref:Gustatory receptor n=1 Tax=Atta cephalotes TaxID=12957 RepID=A0A158P1P4_ATTCE|nr:PREDICTED: uncharacterized protein LOC105627032 [Atta cephalotes]
MVFTVYLTLVEFEINMLYVNCVCVLKSCFKRLNENMTHLQKLIVKPCVSRLTCYIQRDQFLLIQLKILQKQHLMISDTVQMLNLIFSLQLHATVVMTFSDIIFEVYKYVVHWQDGLHITFNIYYLDVFSISVTFYILKIMLIIWACETGKNQAQEISTIIHDVLNSTSYEQIKNELRLFSLQVLHCKNTFSIKGLTIDATLLVTHLMVNETVQLLNIIFSLQLLATVIVTFAEITCEIYDFIVHWQGEIIITFNQHLLDMFLTTMVHYVMKVMLIVWACETGKNQAREISTTIYDVLNSTRDKQIKGELQLFSLQILHCKNTFLTKGLAMDATLLAAMVGGITTYVLIFTQFLITVHSCDEKSGTTVTNNSVI